MSFFVLIILAMVLIHTLTSGNRNSKVHHNSVLANYEEDILEQLGFSDSEDAVQGFDAIFEESTSTYDMIETNAEWDNTVELSQSNIRFWYDGDKEIHNFGDFETSTEYVLELSDQTETYLDNGDKEHTIFAGNQLVIRTEARDLADNFDSFEFKLMHTEIDGYYISVHPGYIMFIDPNASEYFSVTLSGKNAWEIFKDMSWQVVNKENKNMDKLKNIVNPILKNFGIQWH